MKNIFAKKDKRSELEKEFDVAVANLRGEMAGTEEYEKALGEVERIHAMLNADKANEDRVNLNTIIGVGAQILSMVIVVKSEYVGAITTKALQFVTKGRVR